MGGLQLFSPPSTSDLTVYALLNGTRPFTGNVRTPTLSIGGAPITGALLSIPVAATGNSNYGEISIGAGPFDGTTSGFFVGNSNGTHLAINASSGYLGRMIDAQIAGVRMFGVGRGSQASSASATLNAIDIPAFTVSVTGSTNITTAAGFNYTLMGQPTYSAASALAITNAATLAIANAPVGAGAGPATITNAYALWVQGGATRFDGREINTTAGAASAPALLLSGTPFAGTGTTSLPLLYVNDSAATASTTLATAGTYFGVNGHGSADLANLMLDGVSKFKVSSSGVLSATGQLITTTNGTISAPAIMFGATANFAGLWKATTGRVALSVNGASSGVYWTQNGFVTISTGAFAWNSGTDVTTGSEDLVLVRDAANTLAQYNGTTAQESRLYGTRTDTSNNEYLSIKAQAAADFIIAPVKNGTGALRGLQLSTSAGKLGFWGTTAVAQQVLATGAAHTVDDVITFLQTVGLCKQS